MRGLVIAAPQSGSGKTVVTLGLLRHLRKLGLRVAAAKVGPDYIDPGYLGAACGVPCRNLDPWAMRRETVAAEIRALRGEGEIVLCEGVMGLFDGAGNKGLGSTADLAALSGWPVILVVNLEGQAHSVAALVEGFVRHRCDVTVAGVIFNRVGGERHVAMARSALHSTLPGMNFLGAVPRSAGLDLPSRHLGLVPAGEHSALEAFLDRAAALVGPALDFDALMNLARPSTLADEADAPALPPLGARIAVARDPAFVFTYETLLQGWRAAGARLDFFSPLADMAPAADCDAVYLPGGYPELFAARIAGNRVFKDGLHNAARRGAVIYGECGGYMVLGRSLVDAAGTAHRMAGLLPLETSFAARKLHLGYRTVSLAGKTPLGARGQAFRGHEFHYASILAEDDGEPLFRVTDADGASLGLAGRIVGTVMGSFVHLIDRAMP